MAISKIKSAIRSNQRLLSKGVDEETKQSINRKLDGLNYELIKSKEDEVNRKMSSRYHKIKFIEKRKLFRLINSAKNKLSGGDQDSKGKLFKYRLQLNYIINHPTNIKYISVLHSPSNSADTKSRQEKLDEIETKMISGDISNTPELLVFKGGLSKSNEQSQKSQQSKQSEQSDVDDHNLDQDDFFE